MRCPLIMVDRTWGSEEEGKERDRCIKEECSWWDEEKVCCLLRTLTKQITRLASKKEVEL